MKKTLIVIEKGTRNEERTRKYVKHESGWYTVEYSDGSTGLVPPSKVTIENEKGVK